ncbi:MAG: hypothetical protein M1136_01495 [Chloroflexi bacterium]|nr:hypothetical protein [Chloroflexota bacterium]MCL5074314.1 hypothetical protein [Chloroflexota bacterium]
MIGGGKMIGGGLFLIGVGISAMGGLWLLGGLQSGKADMPAMLLGSILLFILVTPLLGSGIYLWSKGRAEERAYAEVETERKILNIVQARGKVRLSDLALETRTSREQIKGYIYDLVGRELFTGYIDWSQGLLYAQEAAQLKEGNKCPNCGATLTLAGKGIIKCEFCGAEIFL